MSKTRFTKKALLDLVPPDSGRTLHMDEVVRGLGLMVLPSGKKSFYWYRKVKGFPTWRTIGEFPDLDIEGARHKANEMSNLAAEWKSADYKGPNPFEKAEVRDEVTLDTMVEEYITKHLREHAKRPEKAEHNLRLMIECYLPTWRGKKLADITEEGVAAFHRRAGAERGHRTANLVVKTLRTMFNFARRAKLWKGENPASAIMFFHENQRTRFLQPDELPKLWAALRKSPNPDFIDFVNLALWTGARKSDVMAMRWQDVSLDANRWTVPDPKSRTPYVVALTPEAVGILKARQRERTGDWIFRGVGASGHVVDFKKRWKQLLKDAGLDYAGQPELKLTQHDLRRTFGSYLAAQGTSLQIIAKGLGHSSTDATQIYARLDLGPVRAALESSNAAISRAMRKKPKMPKMLKQAAHG